MINEQKEQAKDLNCEMNIEKKQFYDQSKTEKEERKHLTVTVMFHAERDGFLLFSPSVISYTNMVQDEQSN